MLVLLIVFCSIIECYGKSIHTGKRSGGAHKRILARNSSYEVASPTNSNVNDRDVEKQSVNNNGYIEDYYPSQQSVTTNASIDEDNANFDYVNSVQLPVSDNAKLVSSKHGIRKAAFAVNPESHPAITNTNANVNARLQHETNNGYIEDTNRKMVSAVANAEENGLKAELRPASSISLANANYKLQPGTSNVYIADSKPALVTTNTNIENSNAGLQSVTANVDPNGVNANQQPVITKSQLANNLEHTITYGGIHDIDTKLQPLVTNTHTSTPLFHMNANATTGFDSSIPAAVDNSNDNTISNRVGSNLHLPAVGGTVINAPAGNQRIEVCTANPQLCGYNYAKKVCDDCYKQTITVNTPLIDDRCGKNACYCCQMSQGNNCNDVCAVAAPDPGPVVAPVTQPVVTPVIRPVAALDTRPVAALDTRPVAALDTRPVAALDTQPVAALDTRPVAALDTRPVAALDTQPVAAPDPQPVHVYINKCQDTPCQCCLNARKVSCEHVCADHSHNGLINAPLDRCVDPCQCCQLTGQKNCAQLCVLNNNVIQQSHHFHRYPVTVVHHNVLHHHQCETSDSTCDAKYTIPHELDVTPSHYEDHHGTEGIMNSYHGGGGYSHGGNDGYSMDTSNKGYEHDDSSHGPNWGYQSDINVKTPLYTDSSHMDFGGGSRHPHSALPHMEFPSPHSNIASSHKKSHHGYKPHHGHSLERGVSMPDEDEADLCDCSCGCNCGQGFTNDGMPKIPGIETIEYIDHSHKGCHCTARDCTCDNVCKDTCRDKCRKKCKCPKPHSVSSHLNETRRSL